MTPLCLAALATVLPVHMPTATAYALTQAAVHTDTDPLLLAAIAYTESAFRPSAVSHAGARGLMQLMPIAVADVVSSADPTCSTAARLWSSEWDDPGTSALVGACYLRLCLTRTASSVILSVAAYNGGTGQVNRILAGRPIANETANYTVKVLYWYNQLMREHNRRPIECHTSSQY